MKTITLHFTLNGTETEVTCAPNKRMLDVLRGDLGQTGTKEGCAVGECGACTVILNGEPVASCLIAAGQMQGAEILTIEGMSETLIGRVLQDCFVEGDAVQCGFCTPGMILATLDLLRRIPQPSREQVRHELSGNLCRCTGHQKIIDAVMAAAASLKGGQR